MKWCFLSPHLDDALLSCGGMIWEQVRRGDEVVILTVCAGDPPEGPLFPFAEDLHRRWQTGREAPAARRQEDLAACRSVGAETQHWNIPDCIYRPDQAGLALISSEQDLWQALPVSQLDLAEEIAGKLTAEFREDTRLVSPAAVGEHLDHRLVRAAAESTGRELLYYPDFPYIAAERPKITPWMDGMLEAYHQPVSELGVQAWINAIRCYASQLSSFWPDDDSLRTAIAAYHLTGGGEALYRCATPMRHS